MMFTWIAASVALALLVLRAFSLLRAPVPALRWFGWLTLLVAAIVGLTFVLVLSGTLIVSTELGLMLASGAMTRVAVCPLLVCLGVAAGFAWQLSRLAVGLPSWMWWRPVVGAFAGLCSAWLVRRIQPMDESSEPVFYWRIISPLSFWVLTCLVHAVLVPLKAPRGWRVVISSGLLLATTVALDRMGELWLVDFGSHPVTYVAAFLAVVLFVAVGRAVYEQRKRGVAKEYAATKEAIHARMRGSFEPVGGEKFIPNSGPRRVLLALALLAILGGLVAFARLDRLDSTLAIALVAFGWVSLPAAFVTSDAAQNWNVEQELLDGTIVFAGLRKRWPTWIAGSKGLFEKGIGAGAKVFGHIAIFKAAAFAFIGWSTLVLANELPRAGHTIINRFDSRGNDDAGRIVSERLVNRLGELRSELQPQVATLQDNHGEVDTIEVPGPNGPSRAIVQGEPVTTNAELEVGTVKLPVAVLFGWIEDPLRRLLRERIITGAVHVNGGKAILLAGSSFGKTWRVETSFDEKVPGDMYRQLAAATDDLAFRITVDDTAVQSTGLTARPDAFAALKSGIEAMNRFDEGDFDAISEAVFYFRSAVEKDKNFALAHYRLGLALRAEGEAPGAIDEFRLAIRINPRFIAAKNELAVTLRGFDWYRPPTTAAWRAVARRPARKANAGPLTAREHEAVALWGQILDASSEISLDKDKALALHGLCSEAHAVARRNHKPVNDVSAMFESQSAYVLAYYYCRRAAVWYEHMAESSERGKQALAQVENLLGLVLKDVGPGQRMITRTGWHCSASAPSEPVPLRPFTPLALRHFRHAVDLEPNDPALACNEATVAERLGEPASMRAMELRGDVRLAKGRDLSQNARTTDPARASESFAQALEEFERAIELNPRDVESMNRYAYTFWLWRYQMPKAAPPHGPDWRVAEKAETFARVVHDLAAGKRSKFEQAFYRSSLGEVLLGQNRPVEAADVLSAALQRHDDASTATNKESPWLDELRWDLALAYLCEVDMLGDELTNKGELANAAARLFEQIQGHQHRSDIVLGEQDQMYAAWADPALRKALRSQAICRDGEFVDIRRPSSVAYGLRERTSKPAMKSNTIGVGAVILDDHEAPVSGLVVHVWGYGADVRLTDPKDQAVLDVPPNDTRYSFMAQVESPATKEHAARLLSAPVPIDTGVRIGPSTSTDVRLVFASTRIPGP